MKNDVQVNLKCQCGALRGVANVPASSYGNRFVCLCDDCQAYAHYLGKADQILDPNGGTDIFPVAPANLKITQGTENIRCVRLSDKGMYRWYAGCCKTAIANTSGLKTPYAGTVSVIMDHQSHGKTRDEEVGPLFARVLGKFGKGELPPGTLQTFSFKVAFKIVRFISTSWIKGQQLPSPFLNAATGEPVAAPYVLSKEERETLRSRV